MNLGAIILCGGRSSRMGRDKALLPLGPRETMLERVVRRVTDVVAAERLVCVAAQEQALPTLTPGVRVLRDPLPDGGPLAALATGLRELRDEVDAAFVCGCDVPLLAPALVARMFARLGDGDIAHPHDGQRYHPLAAVYRTTVLPAAEALLAAGERSLVALAERGARRVVAVPVEELRDVDPELLSLAPCNTPDEFQQALARRHGQKQG